MTHKLRELVKASNPVATPASLLPQDEDPRTLFSEIMHRAGNPHMSTDLLDPTVERRRDMQTQETPIELAPDPRPPSRRRWLVPALAGAAAVIIAIVVAATLLSGNDEPDVTNDAPLTPLEVGEALNQAHVTGDWQAKRMLYADDATFTDLGTVLSGQGNPIEALPFQTSANASELRLRDTMTSPEVDWDGDGRITFFDSVVQDAATDYAVGVTRLHTCAPTDPTTVVCTEVMEGSPFIDSEYNVPTTYTVVDGHITHQQLDFTKTSFQERTNVTLVIEYQEWVRANKGELVENQLFGFFGRLRMTRSTVDQQREVIAEWRAQR